MSENTYTRHGKLISTSFTRISTITKLTISEIVILISYPVTIILGQIVSLFTIEKDGESFQNYFTNKRNLVNLLFVKRGWFWTLAIVVYFNIQFYKIKKSPIISILRITTATIWWYFFTQWFFGLPIMDRIFINTGGICDYDDIVNNQSLFNDVGSKACRKLQGIWTGGHDPSGHVFLLVQSSIILWFELLDIRTLAELKKFGDNYQGKRQWKERALLIASSSIIVLFALLTLWWFMLLITSIHFHSFPEKLTGLFFSYLPILFYLVPRYFNL